MEKDYRVRFMGSHGRGQLVDIHLIDQKMAPKDRVVDIPATNVEEVTAIDGLVGATLRSDGVGPGTAR